MGFPGGLGRGGGGFKPKNTLEEEWIDSGITMLYCLQMRELLAGCFRTRDTNFSMHCLQVTRIELTKLSLYKIISLTS